MDRLSTCYFCGSATVGDLGAVRVAGEDTVTVTLCGDCSDKLDRLASAADGSLTLAAAATTGDTGSASTGDDPTGTPTPEAPADDTGATDPDAPEPAEAGMESDPEPSGRPGVPDDAQLFTESEDPGAFEDDPLAESRESAPEPPADAEDGDGSASADTDPSATETDDTDADGAGGKLGQATDASGRADPPGMGSASGVADDGDDSGTRSVRTSQAAGGRRESSHGTRSRRDDGESTTDEGGAVGEPAASAEAGDERETEDEPDSSGAPSSVPRETYNKVVRLLQNREFPVERASVIEVATSAYGLSRRDCDATIDALVDRGVLEEAEDDENGEGDDRLFRA